MAIKVLLATAGADTWGNRITKALTKAEVMKEYRKYTRYSNNFTHCAMELVQLCRKEVTAHQGTYSWVTDRELKKIIKVPIGMLYFKKIFWLGFQCVWSFRMT